MSELDPSDWPDALDEREWEALSRGYRERVDDLHLASIRRLPQELPELFVQAARRANAVGFDGIELHYAHAYTMASFLSRKNRRDDGFGNSLEGRLRLPIDVLTQCKSNVADGFVVGLRMLSEECIDGGTLLARALAAAGADFISLSRGGKFEDALDPRVGEAIYPYTGPSGYECMPTVYSDERGPFGRNLQATSTVRAFLRKGGLATPVVAAGGFCSYTQMEEALTTGAADIIAAARQSMADPDWWLKLRNGHGQAIRRCEYTNYCEALDQRHKIVTCKLWDRNDLPERGPDLSPDGRRRLIAPSDYDPAALGEKAT